MRRVAILAASAVVLLSLAAPPPAAAQTNDNDYTPLGTRIRHDRQFPFEPPPSVVPRDKMGKVERAWDRAMLSQFGKCLYNRSREGSIDLLEKTDFGFVNFEQIGLSPEKAAKIYGFDDCLHRVAESNESGVLLHYTAMGLRQWLIQAAYAARFPDGPSWLKPGYVIGNRAYPLSANNLGVRAAMDFADCVVAADPYSADYLYRTASGSAEEQEAMQKLTPTFGPCLPQGLRLQLSPGELRVWLGEGLWQAANHSAPAPEEPSKAGQ
jgi:hypothetical protein